MKEIISLKNVSKSFHGVKALKDVSFNLNVGEIHCLVGGNGAGKSTLIKILSGLYEPDCGEIIFDGGEKTFPKLNPSISRQMGIQTIYQETMLAQTLTVAENVFLGDSMPKSGGKVNWKEMRERTRKIMKMMSVDIEPDERVSDLGIAGKQAVQIAKALANDARIMIFDEPTASFGRKEVDGLFDIIRTLKANGVGIIYISHRLEEVFEIADRITVLKDGSTVAHHIGHEVSEEELIREMVGRSTKQFYERERVPIGDVILKVENLCGDGVKNASFELHRGEVLGIGGMVGSKRTELLKLIFGAGNIKGGKIVLNGREIHPASPRMMLKEGMCMITEDRAITGLMLARDLKENIMICDYSKHPRFALNLRKEAKIAQEEMKRLNVKANSYRQLAMSLSGGNQQKIILAKWLLTKGDIFILDEPTRGIDIGAKEEIYKLIVEIARQGGAVLLVSSDMLEIVSMSDRIVVMRDGVSAGELALEDISEENIMRIVVGGENT